MPRKKNFSIIYFYLITALLLSGLFLGFENLSFTNTDWILGSGDKTNAHIAWTFFKNDVWHFPLGKNPNYGLDIANSIIFTDSIPIFAIFFKIFNFVLPENFQYFSLWVFLCFFLQLHFSYLLINFLTKDVTFSLLCSFLFVLLPFYLFRLDHHPSLGGHWLLLMAFYFNLTVSNEKKKIYWFGLILISVLIHFYFTAMLMIIYSVFSLREILIEKKFKKKIIEFLLLFFFIFLLMFVVGYFETSPVNSISTGYGIYKSDFLSIIDPAFRNYTSWSLFIDDPWPSHMEGFNYIGLGNIVIFFFIFFILIKKIYKKELFQTIKYNFDYFVILIIFSLWAFTTNFSIAGINIFNIPINNKYLYGLLSIFGCTGRFLWPPIYMLLIFSIINIFSSLKNNNKYYVVIILIIIQLVDISPKINSNFIEKNSIKIVKPKFTDNVWKIISKDYDKLRTTYLFNNYGPIFVKLGYFISGNNIKATDIILNASMSRANAAKARYDLYNIFNKGLILKDTAYIVDNLGHLKHLKYIFGKSDVGFFYRKDLWIMLPNKKNSMSSEDINRINKINFSNIKKNKIYKLKFSEKEKFLGLGWTHNFNKDGVWSEGPSATLMFNLEKLKKNNYTFNADIERYKLNKNNNYKLSVFINNKLKKNINLNQNDKNNKLELMIGINELINPTIIEFKLEGLISPFDLRINPDARKLGFLLKNFSINEVQ